MACSTSPRERASWLITKRKAILDFDHLFKAYRGEFPFLVGGSDEDPFEHRQVDLAQERLGKLGLQIERLPGGHLTTNERPQALAALIAEFERGLVKIPEL
jgi:pimeloyl-ACP methyl ester carboxylesterase